MVKRPEFKRKERKSNLRDLSIPATEVELEVFKDHDGIRLDAFLGINLPWRSKTSIQYWIGKGHVTTSRDGKAKKSTKLKTGDKVIVSLPEPSEAVRHRELAGDLQFVYEDEDVAAINKSPGLIVHPVSKVQNNTLIQALHWYYRHGPGFREDKKIIPKICHRLDKDTSGLMIVAKNDRTRRTIQVIFEARKVEKRYRALLWGRVDFEKRVINSPIGPDQGRSSGVKMAVRPDGLRALSTFHFIREFNSGKQIITEVEVAIETGRQHQIRVHASHLGHPILCDSLYGLGESKLKFGNEEILSRQALHSVYMALQHPICHSPLELRAPLPADMSAVIRHLEQGHVLTEDQER
jgi:23S rRNA pseudouridine1911/1915/1917 synthase